MGHRGTVVALTAALVAATVPGTAAASGASERVFGIEDCGEPEVRPDRIVLACADFGLYVDKTDWSSWGGRRARAKGVLNVNDCDPSCAEGHFDRYKVKLRLSRIRNRPCGRHDELIPIYTRLRLWFPDEKPDFANRIKRRHITCEI